ncbi:unnamed protein product [Heligmosomoides polygyrus]|uniref:Uncharacterized protein n=1 Tax=Heligmosomoides polygyrus TaxID=6339 RepID=A0A183FI40_HELPZ|nr:unnamed protein product [Heligmosomoides polygyrus]
MLLRASPGPLSRNIKVQACLRDGVVSAKGVAVPSKKSFPQLLSYRGDTEPLSCSAVANTVQARNSGGPPYIASTTTEVTLYP